MPRVAQGHGQEHGHSELLGGFPQAVLLSASEGEVSFRELLLVFASMFFSHLPKGPGVPRDAHSDPKVTPSHSEVSPKSVP